MSTKTGPQRYPGASRANWYQDDFGGDAMQVNVVVLHTTEGRSLPGYGGGTSAPNLTAVPDLGAKKLKWYQHFDVETSSRALVNLGGGVETNTLNVCQVELVGTCDPKTHTKWKNSGDAHVYWPEAPEWALLGVARFLAWMHEEHGVPLSGPRAWPAYPSSYANGGGQRMSGAKWEGFKGVCGHMHVPENCVHPDTPILCGDLTWRRAGDLQVGDEIVSFDEETVKIGNANGGRRYRRGTVTRNEPGTKDSYRITTTEGEVVASADHPWLVRFPHANRGPRIAWVASKDLDPLKHRIVSIGRPWVPEDTRVAGWMAGVLDADGHAFAGGRHGAREEAGRVTAAATAATSTSVANNPKDFTPRPERLLPVAARMWEGAAVGETTGDTAVLQVEHIGLQPIASLSTDTHTYVADGLLCHNTHGDPGAIDFARLLKHAKSDLDLGDDGDEPEETKPEQTKPKVPAFPGRKYFRAGASNEHVLRLGKQLVKRGFGDHYKVGPSKTWGEADRLNVRDFQKSRPELRGDADGHPGPLTWRLLFS
ncbi:peptidoglycan-binding protein [Streptomyces cupreus]|uniref:peptidoglycan-binding protein n=1 Tax=Streptomyces cupreus TaxID=2759956 RepID=UPI0021B3C6EE|nr:peptidoglycan-binding protein [Streptomyces cupreus]